MMISHVSKLKSCHAHQGGKNFPQKCKYTMYNVQRTGFIISFSQYACMHSYVLR